MTAQTPAEIAIAAYDAAVNAELGDEPGTVFGDEGRRNLLDHPAFAAMLAAHERAVLIAAGQKLRDWADEKYPDPFGPTGTRRRAILASARKVEPEPTSAEVGAALTGLLGGMAARRFPDPNEGKCSATKPDTKNTFWRCQKPTGHDGEHRAGWGDYVSWTDAAIEVAS